MRLTDDILSALVDVARDAVLCERAAGVPAIDPICNDLVVGVDGHVLADCQLGWFSHRSGTATYVRPLNWSHDDCKRNGNGLRWLTVDFARVPSRIHVLVEALLRAP